MIYFIHLETRLLLYFGLILFSSFFSLFFFLSQNWLDRSDYQCLLCIFHHVSGIQLSTTFWIHRIYHVLSHFWHTIYLPGYGYIEHSKFHHMSGTPIIHHITGTQNITYFITCLAHHLSTRLWVNRSYHIQGWIQG